jgi:hypothetical protein
MESVTPRLDRGIRFPSPAKPAGDKNNAGRDDVGWY